MKRNNTSKKSETEDIKELRKLAKAGSDKALRESRALGLTVKIIRNNEIIEILPDGEEKIIRKLETEPLKVKGIKKGTVLCKKQ